MITSRCKSDDFNIEIVFDATEYFEKMSDEEIAALSKCNWGGDYPADSVAEYFKETTTTKLFDYIELMNSRDTNETVGFENHVDEQEALEWVSINRPGLLEAAKTRKNAQTLYGFFH